MIERPIEARLRAFYREEAPPSLAAPAELADSVDRIPDGIAPGAVDRRRLTLLLIAAMLAVLGVAFAIEREDMPTSGRLHVEWQGLLAVRAERGAENARCVKLVGTKLGHQSAAVSAKNVSST